MQQKQARPWYQPTQRLTPEVNVVMKTLLHLMDAVQVTAIPELQKLLPSWIEQGAAIDLYKNLPEALHLHGPVLCQLDGPQAQALHQAMGHAPSRWAHMVSTLVPTAGHTLQSCAQHFQEHALTIGTVDAGRYYLRFADTRIFSLMPKVMSEGQWRVFSQCWCEWTHMNRHDQLETLTPESVTSVLHSQGPLWTDEQFSALMTMTWPDALIQQVQQLKPNWLQQATRARRHEVATQVQQQAQANGKEEDVSWQIQMCLAYREDGV